MDSAALGALLAPIKQRYNSEPNAAHITLKAVAAAIDSMRRPPA
ncbi:MAG TPA: hypothetical protein VIJ04_20010 [Xanthobacteraceae bacterium]